MQINFKKDSPQIVVVAGMPRAGTTTLYHNLQKHPAVFVPFRKETHYFLSHYDRGINWFLELYRGAGHNQVGFDISPGYFLDDLAIKRILNFNPETKVILCIRDPVEWILSLYKHHSTYYWRMPAFEDFLQHYWFPLGNKKIAVAFRNKLVTNMIEEYRKAFGSNLLLYDFSRLKRDLVFVLHSIESFVGIPNYFTQDSVENAIFNAADRKANKVITYLTSREQIISLLHILIPEHLLRSLRQKLDLGAVKKEVASPYQLNSPENVRLAEEVFAEERAMIAELFATHEMQLGSGTPFP